APPAHRDFFFQAEDGIRDFHVTGVQTCALPIWREDVVGGRPEARPYVGGRLAGHLLEVLAELGGRVAPGEVRVRLVEADLGQGRSEERRVGKEWSSG